MRVPFLVLFLACAKCPVNAGPLVPPASTRSSAAELAYGDFVQGLRCGLSLEDAHGPLHGAVDTLQDLTLCLRLEAEPGRTLRVVVEQEKAWGRATPYLFDLELQFRDGSRVELPLWELAEDFMPPAMAMASHAELREIGHFSRKLLLLDWLGWQGVILDPGEYRIRAVYRGPPATEDPARAGSYPDAWRGAAASGWHSFTVQGILWNGERLPERAYVHTALRFGPPVEDLHAALELLPRGARYFSGESVRAVFYVENTGAREVYVDRESSSQRDRFQARSLEGVRLGGMFSSHSGTSPATRWWLPPGQLVKLPQAAAIRLTRQEKGEKGNAFLAGPAGRYAFSFTFGLPTQFTTGDHGARRFTGWFLSTEETEIELLPPR